MVGDGWGIILGTWEWVRNYLGWVGVDGSVWEIILGGWGLVGKCFG